MIKLLKLFSFDNKLDEIFSGGHPTLEEPHDDDVMRQGHRVVVELKGVGEGQGHGEHGHVLVVVKAGKHLILHEL